MAAIKVSELSITGSAVVLKEEATLLGNGTGNEKEIHFNSWVVRARTEATEERLWLTRTEGNTGKKMMDMGAFLKGVSILI